MSRRAASVVSAVLVVLGVVPSAYADDDTSALQGLLEEEVVTSASKSAEQTADAPALSRVISAEDIRRYGITSVDEALGFLGVGVRTQNGLVDSEVSARGVGFSGDKGNHMLLLVDGHVINDPLFGSASTGPSLGVPLELIDHIEVVLGPGSAVYGSNAVLGVINVVTKSAALDEGSHVAVESSFGRYGRATLTGNYPFVFLGKRSNLTAGLSYYRMDSSTDLPLVDMGIDPLNGAPYRSSPTGTTAGTWGGHASRALSLDVPSSYVRLVRDRLELTARAVVSKKADPSGPGDFDQPGSTTLERRASVSAKQGFSLGKLGEASARIHGDVFSSESNLIISAASACPWPTARTCRFRDADSGNRAGAELQSTFDWFTNGRVTSMFGAMGAIDHFQTVTNAIDFDSGRFLAPAFHDLDVSSAVYLAAYTQQVVRLTSWLTLNAGGRLDWRQLQDDEPHDIPPIFTPRVSVTVRPWDGAAVKVLYSEAFRAPNAYESDARHPILVQSSQLALERTDSTELIFEQRIKAQRLTFNLFQSHYHNIINRVLLSPDETAAAIAAGRSSVPLAPNTSLFQFQNEDRFTTHGFTTALDGALADGMLHYGASLTGAVARVAEIEAVPVAPQVFGNARVAYQPPNRALPVLALATSFAGRSVSDHSYDQGYAPIPTAPPELDLRATVSGPAPLIKRLTYRMIVHHAFHDRSPFGVGPANRPLPTAMQPALAPVRQWDATLGLQYDF